MNWLVGSGAASSKNNSQAHSQGFANGNNHIFSTKERSDAFKEIKSMNKFSSDTLKVIVKVLGIEVYGYEKGEIIYDMYGTRIITNMDKYNLNSDAKAFLRNYFGLKL